MTNNQDEAEIHAIIEARANAVQGGDVDTLVEDLAQDVVSFDVVEPLRREGRESSRKRASEWLASFDGRASWENRDVAITADGGVAFSHSLSRVIGTLKTGAKIDMWFRTTLGFRRIEGRWVITHEHGSVPFDPGSGKASLGLDPQKENAMLNLLDDLTKIIHQAKDDQLRKYWTHLVEGWIALEHALIDKERNPILPASRNNYRVRGS